MKEGWKYEKLGEVCEIFGRIGFRGYTRKDYVNTMEEGAISLSPSNIKNNQLVFSNCTYITWDKYNQSPEIMISKGDVVFVKTASIGKCAYVSELPHETTINPQFVVFKNIKISNRFLFHQLQSPSFQNKVKSITTGTSVPTISQKGLSELEISYPDSISEQERIVERLDAAFAQIDELKSNAERQLAEARALFQSALSQAMQPKPGWQEKTLGDITTSMADGPFGSNLKKEHYTDRPEVRIIQLSNIGEDGWREENTKYTTFEHLKSIQRSEVLPGDIVIAKMMPAGRAIICPSHEAKFVLSSDAVRATLKDNLNRRFIFYAINSPFFKKQVYENVSGSGRVRTSLTKLRACKLFIPSNDMQDKVVKQIDSLYKNVRELEEISRKTAAECDAMKQALLRQIFE